MRKIASAVSQWRQTLLLLNLISYKAHQLPPKNIGVDNNLESILKLPNIMTVEGNFV